MKIFKLASSIQEVSDQSAFLFFKKALKFITWANIGEKRCKKIKEANGWSIYRTQRQGIIKQSSGHRTPEFILYVYVYEKQDDKPRYKIELLSKRNVKIANWQGGTPDADAVYGGELKELLSTIGITDVLLPNEMDESQKREEARLGLIPSTVDGKRAYNYIRLTKQKDSYSNAQSLEFWLAAIQTKRSILGTEEFQGVSSASKFHVFFRKNDLESGFNGQTLDATQDREGLQPEKAVESLGELVGKATFNGFVDETSPMYIPKDAGPNNWDFSLNIRKYNQNVAIDHRLPDMDEENNKISSFGEYMMKTSQNYDFGGYYSGNIPDPSSYVGTSAVEAGQIKATFSGADKAIQYVNEFNSNLLKNIAFIFNFSKAGAYGVYLSELDRAIKTEVLKKKLNQKGYKIVDEHGILTAYPEKAEMPTEQIDKDINTLYDDINKDGGTAIGINMGNVLSAAQADLSNIPNTEPQFLYEQLSILHLGETIVHEAIHAKGHHDEGPSEQGEAAFASWVLPKINKAYMEHLKSVGKENEFNEIIIGTSKRHASSVNWYKEAQYAMPHNLFSPNGSDLSGRMGGWSGNLRGRQDFSMMFNQMSHESIEKRLGRQYMWPLAQDIELEKDSIEEQLRKTFKSDRDMSKSTEELLQKDRAKESELYKSVEEKLDDNRPAPLLQTLKKDASIKKVATLFGWFNNLEISDGSSIPGLSDRVMAWDDRDEDFAWSDKDIRQQPRYNPEYDIKGFYYRWIEPRFAPQLFDDMTQELSNTHPAKRFAQNSCEDDAAMDQIAKIISRAKDYVANGKVKACRFIVSDDLAPFVSNLLANSRTILIPMEETPEPSSSLWISGDGIEDDKIEQAEKYFRGDNAFEMVANELLGLKNTEKTLDQVISLLKKINGEENLDDIYLVGEPAREKLYGEKISSGMFRFCCKNKEDAATYGQLLANSMGCEFDYNKNGDMIMFVGDIVLVFHSGENQDVCEKLMSLGASKEDMADGITCELSNKDFTINMIALNVVDGSAYDPFGVKADIENKVIRSKYHVSDILVMNPMIVLKMMKMMKDGYSVEESYKPFMHNAMSMLSDLDGNMIEFARMFVINNGIIDMGE